MQLKALVRSKLVFSLCMEKTQQFSTGYCSLAEAEIEKKYGLRPRVFQRVVVHDPTKYCRSTRLRPRVFQRVVVRKEIPNGETH